MSSQFSSAFRGNRSWPNAARRRVTSPSSAPLRQILRRFSMAFRFSGCTILPSMPPLSRSSMPLPADELLGDCRLTEAGLAFGSNIGDKPGNIRRALELLESRRIVSLTAISSIYRTPPWGYLEQEDFANACALARTRLPPLDLLKATRQIETDMGRRPTVRWGPRLIDIDILYYGETLFEHGFVLVPLAEIAPDLRIAGRSIKESAAAFAGERIPKWEEKA